MRITLVGLCLCIVFGSACTSGESKTDSNNSETSAEGDARSCSPCIANGGGDGGARDGGARDGRADKVTGDCDASAVCGPTADGGATVDGCSSTSCPRADGSAPTGTVVSHVAFTFIFDDQSHELALKTQTPSEIKSGLQKYLAHSEAIYDGQGLPIDYEFELVEVKALDLSGGFPTSKQTSEADDVVVCIDAAWENPEYHGGGTIILKRTDFNTADKVLAHELGHHFGLIDTVAMHIASAEPFPSYSAWSDFSGGLMDYGGGTALTAWDRVILQDAAPSGAEHESELISASWVPKDLRVRAVQGAAPVADARVVVFRNLGVPVLRESERWIEGQTGNDGTFALPAGATGWATATTSQVFKKFLIGVEWKGSWYLKYLTFMDINLAYLEHPARWDVEVQLDETTRYVYQPPTEVNLAVLAVSLGAHSARRDEQIARAITIANAGTTPFGGELSVNFFLSKDKLADAQDVSFGGYSLSVNLQPGEQVTKTPGSGAPGLGTPLGTYYVLAKIEHRPWANIKDIQPENDIASSSSTYDILP